MTGKVGDVENLHHHRTQKFSRSAKGSKLNNHSFLLLPLMLMPVPFLFDIKSSASAFACAHVSSKTQALKLTIFQLAGISLLRSRS